jgi:hypothetical protein
MLAVAFDFEMGAVESVCDVALNEFRSRQHG